MSSEDQLRSWGIMDVKTVFHEWSETESDWPGNTIVYLTDSNECKTVVYRDVQFPVFLDGWKAPWPQTS